MDVQTRPTQTAGSSVPSSPVDDHTYNVLQSLTSTLEAIEAYETYAREDRGEIFDRLLAEERSHATILLEELRSCLGRSRADRT
jgi:hypothetical protein